MNQREAFRETLEIARANGLDNCSSDYSELDYAHLQYMYAKIIEADAAGEPFSEPKIGRWLGWAQAAVVANGGGDLADMKEINMRHK
jgi:hypothetical protein